MYVTKRPWDLPAWSTGRLYCSKHMDLLMLQGQKPLTEKEISRVKGFDFQLLLEPHFPSRAFSLLPRPWQETSSPLEPRPDVRGTCGEF